MIVFYWSIGLQNIFKMKLDKQTMIVFYWSIGL